MAGHTCRLMETRMCPDAGPCPELACARFESDDPGPWLPHDQGPDVTLKLRPVPPPPEAA